MQVNSGHILTIFKLYFSPIFSLEGNPDMRMFSSGDWMHLY